MMLSSTHKHFPLVKVAMKCVFVCSGAREAARVRPVPNIQGAVRGGESRAADNVKEGGQQVDVLLASDRVAGGFIRSSRKR
eukprot:scaffold104378_cov20-Tisochrysis_lutea.AAC.1